MGCFFMSKSSYDPYEQAKANKYKDLGNTVYTDLEKASISKNPDPSKFNIITWVPVDKYLVVCIEYPNCENYEGKKVLVYEDLTIEQLRRFDTIDPHFSESKKFKSPIARFIPTVTGMDMAVKFCLSMIN
jgi:hypothetical protein